MKALAVSRVVACILSACAIADARDATVTAPAEFLARASGVYEELRPDSLAPGGKFPSENILEVVPVDDGHAYIRMRLELGNHMGTIHGIATYSGHDSLVYDNGKAGSEKCAIGFSWSKLYVSTTTSRLKTGGCRDYHDAEGSPDQIRFLVARKRNITNMQRLKDSRDFRSAMDEYRARGTGT